MKSKILALIFIIFVISLPVGAQNKTDYSKIDMMLIRSDFNRAIDSCKQILALDTLNSEIYYKLGLAYQNQVPDDKSFDCFLKAATLSPENSKYSFMVAKYYYNNGKVKQAEPLLLNLCAKDTMNWPYAYYLTSIYMQRGRYDESIKI